MGRRAAIHPTHRHAAQAGLIGAILILAGIGSARAAGFDCAKAAAPDERAICASRSLSESDVEMSALWFSYSRLPFLMGANGQRRDEQLAFLTSRASCGADLACLRALYAARIAALKAALARDLKSAGPECEPPPAAR
jgi:uncharacterized protein